MPTRKQSAAGRTLFFGDAEGRQQNPVARVMVHSRPVMRCPASHVPDSEPQRASRVGRVIRVLAQVGKKVGRHSLLVLSIRVPHLGKPDLDPALAEFSRVKDRGNSLLASVAGRIITRPVLRL